MFSYFKLKTRTTAGDIFGRYTLLGPPFRIRDANGSSHSAAVCQCQCGTIAVVRLNTLRRSTSGGCHQCVVQSLVELNRSRSVIKNQRLHSIWRGMIRRCYQPKYHHFNDYGGRGVTVCREWRMSYQSFEAWALANGYSDNLTIERNNNEVGYEPGNCRWATMKEQQNNRRNNRRVTAWGETKTIAMWLADPRCRAKQMALYGRLHRGWPAELAISFPTVDNRAKV